MFSPEADPRPTGFDKRIKQMRRFDAKSKEAALNDMKIWGTGDEEHLKSLREETYPYWIAVDFREAIRQLMND